MGHEQVRQLSVGGIEPFTRIDFPGRLAAVVFVQGCPWRCGYCHNPHLQPRERSTRPGAAPWPEVVAWLRRRTGLLDAVVFSGGEPTIDPGLRDAVDNVRELGFEVGLHTAGIYPRRLRELLPRLDWVGLDVKAPLSNTQLYDRVVGKLGGAARVRASLDHLQRSGVAYECRTTAAPSWLADEDLRQLAGELASLGVTNFALQVARAGDLRVAGADYPGPAAVACIASRFSKFTLRRD